MTDRGMRRIAALASAQDERVAELVGSPVAAELLARTVAVPTVIPPPAARTAGMSARRIWLVRVAAVTASGATVLSVLATAPAPAH